MAFRAWVVLVGALSTAGVVCAQTDITGAPSEWRGTPVDGSGALISTNKYGEPQFVSVRQTVAPAFVPSEVTGERLADEFKLLCLDTALDSNKLGIAIAKSEFRFSSLTLTVEPQKKDKPHYLARVWHDDGVAANEVIRAIRVDLDPPRYLAWAQQWVASGATMIGGCCGIGPSHIAALANGLRG